MTYTFKPKNRYDDWHKAINGTLRCASNEHYRKDIYKLALVDRPVDNALRITCTDGRILRSMYLRGDCDIAEGAWFIRTNKFAEIVLEPSVNSFAPNTVSVIDDFAGYKMLPKGLFREECRFGMTVVWLAARAGILLDPSIVSDATRWFQHDAVSFRGQGSPVRMYGKFCTLIMVMPVRNHNGILDFGNNNRLNLDDLPGPEELAEEVKPKKKAIRFIKT